MDSNSKKYYREDDIVIAQHLNSVSPSTFGELRPEADGEFHTPGAPLMATPAAVAAGATIVGGAFTAGLTIGLAND